MNQRAGSFLLLLVGSLCSTACGEDSAGDSPVPGAGGSSTSNGMGGGGMSATSAGASNLATMAGTGGTVTVPTATGGTAMGGAPSTATAGSSVGGMAAAGGMSSMGGAGNGGTDAGGSAGTMGHASGRSDGCGQAVMGTHDQWFQHDIQVTVDPEFAADFGARIYWTRPPADYDPNTAYPLVVWGQGCGQGGNPEETPISTGPAADFAIQVELLADGDNHACYSAGPDGDNANSPELPYFDAVLAEVEASFCVDKGKVYMGGWSSGGWLTSLLACTRTDVIKGVGWASAGLQLNHPECMGPMPAVVERGTNDNGTPLDQTLDAVESLRTRNGCSMDTQPWKPGEMAFDTNDCVEYQGCMPGFPLIWCPLQGQGHNNGGSLSRAGFWQFWSELP